MQKEKLIVKNFFTLKNVEIELSKFNVFIGEQASGKSLLIKLISFFNIMLLAGIDNAESKTFEQFFNHLFYDIFRIDYTMLHKDFQISYQFNEFSILAVKNDGQKLQVNLKVQGMTKPTLSGNTYQRFFPAGRTFLVDLHRNIFKMLRPLGSNGDLTTIDPLLFAFGEQYQDAIESFNKPAGYMQPLNELKNGKRDEHINWFDNKFFNILKGRFVYDSIGGFIEQGTGSVRPWHSSTGQQEALPIYLVLRNYLYDRLSSEMTGSLYIEEPEAHLYPTAQKDILELLVYVTNVIHSNGIYITTHSPYILTVLNNLIMANDVKDKQPDFEPNLLVPFEDVRAYCIAGGSAHSLMNEEYRVIDAEKLDEVSNTISREYSKMVDLLYAKHK